MANYKANEEEQKMSSGYEIDGFWYPRVTKIVGIKAKPALYHFYAKMQNFAEGERIKQQSAKEGTLIHETIEDILLGKEPDIPESIEPSIIMPSRSISLSRSSSETLFKSTGECESIFIYTCITTFITGLIIPSGFQWLFQLSK